MTTDTPLPTEPDMLDALKDRIGENDDYARDLEAAAKTWAALDGTLASNDTVMLTETPATIPWPVRPAAPPMPLFEELAAALPDATIVLDPLGGIRFWNPAAEQLFGWMAFEVTGLAPPFLTSAHVPEHDSILRETHRDSPIRERIVSRRTKSGQALTLHLTTRLLSGGDVAMIFRPIETVKAPTVSDTTAAPPQSVKLETLGRMVAAVSHDFNNVLAAICGSADLLADRIAIMSPDREWVEVIRAAGRHAEGLTRRLMQLSKPSPMTPRSCDLTEAVQDLMPLVKALVPAGVRVKLNADPSLPATGVDPTVIEQVLLNLATNAGQAMPHGGSLQIRTGVSPVNAEGVGRYVILTVADSGAGFDSATRARLFEPYFTSRATGTGLGLATVRELVEQSGGFIEVDSVPSLGSVFRVFFPARMEPASMIDADGRTALVADDDPAIREVVKRVLESVGFNVTEAATGEEAVQRARWDEVDLLVADVVMPGFGGRKLADKLRMDRPDLAVLYVSSYPDAGDAAPHAQFLSKPFTPKQVLAAVRQLLPAVVRA